MANPFEKRATEYLRDSDTFLSIITPEPLRTFLERPAREGTLYDRLAIIVGTPGSGKTTIASVLQFHLVDAVRRVQGPGYKELLKALIACGALDDDERPRVAGVRLPLEAEYRDFWELPYSRVMRTKLVRALLEARAVIGWIRNLTSSGHYSVDDVRIVPRPDAAPALAAIGGLAVRDVHARAIEVERAVYGIGAALVPPTNEESFPAVVRAAYHPLDAIEAFELATPQGPLRLIPLVMLDDAHTLHPEQFTALRDDLARRELKIARWILTRLDAFSPRDALLGSAASGHASPSVGRDITEIAMQKGTERARDRAAFRKMARDMANRYLLQIPEFRRRKESFTSLLGKEPDELSEASRRELGREVDRVQRELRISASRREALETEITKYAANAVDDDVGTDVQLGMLLVLMHRYAKRVPQGSLFAEADDADPAKPLKANAGVAAAARIHLLHRFGRAYYYGVDDVCDASSENAERFLRLAGHLVSLAETRLVRKRNPVLESKTQHRELVEAAARILAEADYPYAREVRVLTDAMAEACRARTLEPNAPLHAGASAFGVPQDDFDQLARTNKRLARVLQFAVAYNELILVQNYGQGGKNWCLFELGGCVLVKHGLTLQRGGFLERTVAGIDALLPPEET